MGVGPRIGALDDSEVRDSAGFGLRIGVERSAIFRLDLGFSDEDTNLAIVYGLGF